MTTADPTGDAWLDQRLANRRKPGDPDYDAFYDATDTELAAMMDGPAKPATTDLPADVLTAAHNAAAQRVSEMDGWDYDDQARAAVDAALPHITAHYNAHLARYAALTDTARTWARLRDDRTAPGHTYSQACKALAAEVGRLDRELDGTPEVTP
ncbi:MAG TPA: hypothetical protein VFR67_06130 [Pilimelia sp.]|nr:hypothetical protein [Pilimelia sp.]